MFSAYNTGYSRSTYFVLANSILFCILFSGCAALTNPVAQGIPVRKLPLELLSEPKEGKETIPLTYLRREPPDVYRLDAGDVLGVYIEKILGNPDQPPPITYSDISDLPPSLGYPIPVREDGSLSLPLIKPVQVRGLTVAEAEQKIIAAYTTDGDIIVPGRERIIVTMFRPREVRVLVIRQDSSQKNNLRTKTSGRLRNRSILGNLELEGGTQQGTGTIVSLPADKNDVLHALTLSGGLPGLDAANEVIIQRGYMNSRELAFNGEMCRIPPVDEMIATEQGQTIRIPLRMFPGEPPMFSAEDIILHDGDIMFIEAREFEVFYAGGLLPSGEYRLPRDYDLDVLEAVAQIGGPVFNGGINLNNLNGQITTPGIGNPSPRLATVLRRSPDGRQVMISVDLFLAARDPRENLVLMPSDYLILQETKPQAIARYATQVFRFDLISDVISRSTTTGTAAVGLP
jgi:hypothetical protein